MLTYKQVNVKLLPLTGSAAARHKATSGNDLNPTLIWHRSRRYIFPVNLRLASYPKVTEDLETSGSGKFAGASSPG
jgi:hypothetical protein